MALKRPFLRVSKLLISFVTSHIEREKTVVSIDLFPVFFMPFKSMETTKTKVGKKYEL